MTAPGFVPRPDKSVIDRIAKLEARIRTMQQALAGATTSSGTRMFTRYQATTTTAQAGSLTPMMWGAPVEGSGVGLTLTNATTFLLGAGIWRVACSVTAASGTGGLTLELADNPVHGAVTSYHAQANCGVVNGQAAVTAHAEIHSTGSAILVAFLSAATATGALTAASNGLPRLTFNWSLL